MVEEAAHTCPRCGGEFLAGFLCCQRAEEANQRPTSYQRRSLLGTSFGPYQLSRKIGSWAWGEIFSAHSYASGKNLSLQILSPTLASEPEHLTDIFSEALLAASLGQGAVLSVLDSGFLPEEGAYLVAEPLQGEMLTQRVLRQGPLPQEEILPPFLALLEALTDLHQAGLHHGAITPEHLFWAHDARAPRLILLGFGIARRLAPYIERPDERQDLVGVCAAMGFALTGQPDPEALPEALRSTALPEELRAILLKALAKGFSDAGTLAAALLESADLALKTTHGTPALLDPNSELHHEHATRKAEPPLILRPPSSQEISASRPKGINGAPTEAAPSPFPLMKKEAPSSASKETEAGLVISQTPAPQKRAARRTPNSSAPTMRAPALDEKAGPQRPVRPIEPPAPEEEEPPPLLSPSVVRKIPLAQRTSGRFLALDTARKRWGFLLLCFVLLSGGFVFFFLRDQIQEHETRPVGLAKEPETEVVVVLVRSNPDRARVTGTVNGEPLEPFTTPGDLTVKQGAQLVLSLERIGYEPLTERMIAEKSGEVVIHMARLPEPAATLPAATPEEPAPKVSKAEPKPSRKPKGKASVRPKTSPPKPSNKGGERFPLPPSTEL